MKTYIDHRTGELMDKAARLTPDGWDFALAYSANDVLSLRAEWVAGWYPTFRAHLAGDALLDAVILGHGPTAADATGALLDKAGRLPR